MTTSIAGPAKPVHDLAAIHQAAAAGHVRWQDSVNDDLHLYEYSVDDVLDCLQALCLHHFSKTLDYNDGKGPFDVYKLPWHHFIPSKKQKRWDILYIKIKVTKNGQAAFMLSFHPS